MSKVKRYRVPVLTVFSIFCVLVSTLSSAQGLLLQKIIGGIGEDFGGSVLDSQDNIYVTGWFEDTIDLGIGPVTSAGSKDIFLAKYDSAGNHLWSKRFGDADLDSPGWITVDSNDNVILIGFFLGTLNLGGSTFTSVGTSLEDDDIFVAKFDSSGNHLWSRAFGTPGWDSANSVDVDSQDNIIVSGFYDGPIDFGGGPLNFVGSEFAGEDIFVAKFDPSGNHLWSKGFGSTGEDWSNAVRVDGLDNVILTGFFGETVDFGGGSRGSMTSGFQAFLAKYDSAGHHIWSKAFSGLSSMNFEEVLGFGLAVDGSNNIAFTGWFDGTVDFGGGPVTSAFAGSIVGFGSDAFIAKYDSAGNYLWSRNFGAADFTTGNVLAFDTSGNLALTGEFQNTVDFGGGPFTSAGDADAFIVKYDNAGSHLWSKTFGGIGEDSGGLVDFDSTGSILFSGWFSDTVDFGNGPVTSAGFTDVFILKFPDPVPPPCGLIGDINDDGAVTPGDAQAAFDHFLGLSTPTCVNAGDVCPAGGDGNVTPGDAQGIFNMFLGLPMPCQ